MTVPATAREPSELLEEVVIRGNLAELTPEQRIDYYQRVCATLGLNPLTQPFAYMTLQGRLLLYARKDATDQLRKINAVSVTGLTQAETQGVWIATCTVEDKGGRTDAATGVVFIHGLKGEALANAMMKAETKAKRRATLSICGLGFFDETEIDDIPEVRRAPRARPNVMLDAAAASPGSAPPPRPIPHDGAADAAAPGDPVVVPSPGAATVTEESTESEGDRIARLNKALEEAAAIGGIALRAAWEKVPARDQHTLHAALERVHKPAAQKADRAARTSP